MVNLDWRNDSLFSIKRCTNWIIFKLIITLSTLSHEILYNLTTDQTLKTLSVIVYNKKNKE